MLRAAVLATTLLLALAACESEEPAKNAEPDATAIETGLAGLFAGDHPGDRETEDGRCFAAELTELTTPEELQRAGVLDASYDVMAELPSLPEDVAQAWVDAQFACTDFVEASTRAQEKVTKGQLDAEAYAACLRAALSEEQVRSATVASLTGDWESPEVAELTTAQTSCAESA